MKSTVPSAILVAMIIGGVCILAIIVSLTLMAISGREIPPGVSALFGAIVTAFLTGVFSVVSHTLGFANGTTNGEAQAIKDSLLSYPPVASPPAEKP